MALTQEQESVYERIEAATGISVDAGLDALKKMQQMLRDKRKQISDLKRKNIALEARYGSKGQGGAFWEHVRKVKLKELEKKHHDLAVVPRVAGEPAGKKPSDDTLDRLAHADPAYVEFLSEVERNRTLHLQYIAELDDLYTDVEYIQGGIDRIKIRLRMDEEAVRYERATANLSQ